ncbi:MAG: hypothetical protein COU46_02610 [Candidatus Niyogibacteria bacterium CG10_big_fil_rev_8_21_14_0_10_42_19]|uniref:Uncharacterized protein n=1 Tax=Candidatus Niyogibacteria bacterium CG10_big_fil_rev_8_21_14_0_10_42_19 TaxID=1974725 RepID=A0A2H0TF92_9BACT|nr:MAG: hypothetical protein COU46_02610 [Candidatus Niyogibacteria bacterium CG10_big_fil_rev_8_21_14_0_10_42_19]
MYRQAHHLVHKIACSLIYFYAACLSPWTLAKFKVAWEEYQQDQVYRHRIRALGLGYAIDAFVKDGTSREYLYSRRVNKDPLTRLQVIFIPWSIPLPAILQTVANQGYFNK